MTTDTEATIGGDAWADIQPGTTLSEKDARTTADAMLAAGVPAETVNAELAKLGYGPVDASVQATASRDLAALKSSPEWVAKFNAGDPGAVEQFNKLTAQMTFGAKAEAPLVRAEEYRLPAHHPVLSAQDTATQQRFDTETRAWAEELQLQPNVAAAIAEYALDAVAKRAGMSTEQQEAWGHREEAMFLRLFSDPADIAHAERWLTAQQPGKPKFDLRAVARERGANVANELFLHAAYLAETSG